MGYQALYRKWRPRVFADVVGQEHITDTLRNQVVLGKTAHAYLFTGSRGTGKTTCSKILAKAVNCQNPQNGDPCCQCDICKGIEDGTVLDVVEIDAASNNGVDNIRDLREEANFTPASAKYRVYIIDETHMLSIGAFNALLKIMEEPPPHVLFILATTEVHKVPATVLSRCQRFDFHRIDPEKIADRLELVAQGEGFALERDAALLIARLSDGGMRDALSLLDVCLSRVGDSGQAVDGELVSQAAGLAGNEYLFSLAQAVLEQDLGRAMEELAGLSDLSVEFEQLCRQFIGHYRNLMVARAVGRPENFVLCLPKELEQLKAQAQAYSMARVLYSIDCLGEALNKMGKGSGKRLEMEMALVRLCSPSLSGGEAAVLARLQALEDKLRAGVLPAFGTLQHPQVSQLQEGPAGSESASQPPATVTASPEGTDSLSSFEEEETPVSAEPIQPPTEEKPPKGPENQAGGTSRKKEKPQVQPLDCWGEVLDLLSRTNPALYGALQGSVAYEAGDLVLIDSRNTFFLEMVRKGGVAKNSIRDALFSFTGKKYRLGPYRETDYQVKKEDPLEKLLKSAEESGIPIEITE